MAAAFTLLEVMLSLALMVLLFSLAAFNYLGWARANDLEEGKTRVETLVRMCRAESCNLGKRIQLAVGDEGVLSVLVEADPLEAPGVFTPMEASWAQDLPNELVRVVRSELIGSSSWRLIQHKENNTKEGEPPLQAVTFFPDASVDSAEIELREARGDGQHALVTINGLTGEIASNIFTPLTEEEQAELERQKEQQSQQQSTAADSGAEPPPPPCPGEGH